MLKYIFNNSGVVSSNKKLNIESVTKENGNLIFHSNTSHDFRRESIITFNNNINGALYTLEKGITGKTFNEFNCSSFGFYYLDIKDIYVNSLISRDGSEKPAIIFKLNNEHTYSENKDIYKIKNENICVNDLYIEDEIYLKQRKGGNEEDVILNTPLLSDFYFTKDNEMITIKKDECVIPVLFNGIDDNKTIIWFYNDSTIADYIINNKKYIRFFKNDDRFFYENNEGEVIKRNGCEVLVADNSFKLNIPLNNDFALNINQEDEINTSIVNKEKEKLIPYIVDMEKKQISPAFYTDKDKNNFSLINEIDFNFHFRERDIENGWEIIGNKYWNGYDIDEVELTPEQYKTIGESEKTMYNSTNTKMKFTTSDEPIQSIQSIEIDGVEEKSRNSYEREPLTFKYYGTSEDDENGSLTFEGSNETFINLEYSINNGKWIKVENNIVTLPNIKHNSTISWRGLNNGDEYNFINGVFSSTVNGKSRYFDVYGNIKSLIYSKNFVKPNNGSELVETTDIESSLLTENIGKVLVYEIDSSIKYYIVYKGYNDIIEQMPFETDIEMLMGSADFKIVYVSVGNEQYPRGLYKIEKNDIDNTISYLITKIGVEYLIREKYIEEINYDKNEIKRNLKGLFQNCKCIRSAKNLILPDVLLVSECYNSMFKGCTSLIEAPLLNALELIDGCYTYMFSGCTSLETAPELPATVLANSCYERMFANYKEIIPDTLNQDIISSVNNYDGCINLKKAPKLPATMLYPNCYAYMFSGCTSLEVAPELPALELVPGCYNCMFAGCYGLKEITCKAVIFDESNGFNANFFNITNKNNSNDFKGNTNYGEYVYYYNDTVNTYLVGGGDNGSNTEDNIIKIFEKDKQFYQIIYNKDDIEIINDELELFSNKTSNVVIDKYQSSNYNNTRVYLINNNYNSATSIHKTGVYLIKYNSFTQSNTAEYQNNEDIISAVYIGNLDNDFTYKKNVNTPDNILIDNNIILPEWTIESFEGEETYYDKYLTFTALENNSILSFNVINDANLPEYYSSNKGGWVIYTPGEKIKLQKGEEVKWKHVNKTHDQSEHFITLGGYFDVSGNAMSMIYGDNFTDSTNFKCEIQIQYNSSQLSDKVDNKKNKPFLDGKMTEHFIKEGDSVPTVVFIFGNIYSSNDIEDAMNLSDFKIIDGSYKVNYVENLRGLFHGCSHIVNANNLILQSGICLPEINDNVTNIYTSYENLFGGCTSLETAPKLPAMSLGFKCYGSMFANCEKLKYMPKLPATIMKNECYRGMFAGCKNIEIALELPATVLANSCYNTMFSECTGLIVPPILPATILADNCYGNMFSGCTSLEVAPELPAIKLVNGCYNGMFNDCANLRYMSVRSEDFLNDTYSYTIQWLNNVSSSGYFLLKNNGEYDNSKNVNGIPSGWKILGDCYHKDKVFTSAQKLNENGTYYLILVPMMGVYYDNKIYNTLNGGIYYYWGTTKENGVLYDKWRLLDDKILTLDSKSEYYVLTPRDKQYAYNTNGSITLVSNNNKLFYDMEQSDLLGYLGFNDDDVFYEKNKLKESFIRLLFYDKKDIQTQQLLFYSTIFYNSKKLYGKYTKNKTHGEYYDRFGTPVVGIGVFNEYNAFKQNNNKVDETKRLSTHIEVFDEYSKEASEGFYIYLFGETLPTNEEKTIYMKVEFNHAGYGRTIPLTMPVCEDIDGELHPLKKDGVKIKVDKDGTTEMRYYPKDYKIIEDGKEKIDMNKLYQDMFIEIRIRYDFNLGKYIWYLPRKKDSWNGGDGSNKKIIFNLFEPRLY